MSETRVRHSWDSRRAPDQHHHHNERKRKSEDDYHGKGRRDEGRSRQHRESSENKRHRGYEDDDKHHGHEENRYRDSDDKQYRSYDDKQQYNRSRDYDDKPTRNDRVKKSRFEQAFVKKESSPEWGKATIKQESKSKPQEKEKPNFQTSGKLTEDTNTVNGVVIKYTEPLDARKPKRRWRLYPFKGEKALPVLYIHRQSAYLMGRDRKIADIPLDHPSCSKQHAALQYRLVSYKRENGTEGKKIRPYLIDLESANGTFVNDVKLEPKRFHELLERDVIKFGFSTREYVVLHEQSKDENQDDDVNET
ncbi:PREDICTED: smad nuclear-interacting protein 1 [Ceratosolen solmsi marchali]|uniref:Smad nuclear-interacting protein 1 n=1 Tax=Ceratosolen solmsi marchali TaxID=326594 RepID=A0AAJ6VJV9_9HYME|nr:PREDICTED: smad nuclear-interacting protein 1 [Ceratosolen solmsi marchali]XP_011494068.1 PREDICTED: smad nuclear-interacting protein 1 [Ceratosolen solmsi marchali]